MDIHNKVTLYVLPYWCKNAIEFANLDLSVISDDKSLNRHLQGKVSGLDIADIILSNYSIAKMLGFNQSDEKYIFDKDAAITNPWSYPSVEIEDYFYSPSNHTNILNNLKGISDQSVYDIKTVNSSMIVIIMNDGFGTMIQSSGEGKKKFYKDLIETLMRVAPFYAVASTGIYKQYLLI